MSYKRVETLGDASRHGVWLEIICKGEGCGRTRHIPPDALLGRGKFHAGVTIVSLGDRMRCRGKDLEGGGCGHRGAVVRAVFQPSPDDDGPPGGGGAAIVPFPVERRRAAAAFVEAAQAKRRRRARARR